MRKRSPAKIAASSPPVPARISRIAFFSSAASLGRRSTCNSPSKPSIRSSTFSRSTSARSRISRSMLLSASIESRSASSASAFFRATILPAISCNSEYSEASFTYSSGAGPAAICVSINSKRFSTWSMRSRGSSIICEPGSLGHPEDATHQSAERPHPAPERAQGALEWNVVVLGKLHQTGADIGLRGMVGKCFLHPHAQFLQGKLAKHGLDRTDGRGRHGDRAEANAKESHGGNRLARKLTADGNGRVVRLACLHDLAQQSEEGNADRIKPVGDTRIAAIRRGDELEQIVGTDGDEIHRL